jgi:electron transport complex protein RnfE
MSLLREFTKGIIKENPTFRLVLGMCPTLAVTTSVENGIGMGLAATFVLVGSNMVISAIRKVVPSKVRIPCYIVVIAAFVTILEMLMQAYVPALYKSLGIFIPLIVVNCIILGRAEAFAAKNGIVASMVDGLGMGLGFTLALVLVSSVRELAGGVALLAVLPPGGFIILGILLATMNAIQNGAARRRGQPAPAPVTLDCRHCAICKLGD